MRENNFGYLVLVRHATSVRNRTKRVGPFFKDKEALGSLAGIPDHKIPILEEGWDEAREAGRKLRTAFPIPNRITHSGYLRTVQTTEGILEAYEPEVRKEMPLAWSPLIRERHAGYGFEMWESIAAKFFPWLGSYWQTWKHMFAEPPGGESIIRVADRALHFLKETEERFRKDPERTEFVVAHGISIHAMRFILERWTYEEADAAYSKSGAICNAAWIAYRFSEGGFVPIHSGS